MDKKLIVSSVIFAAGGLVGFFIAKKMLEDHYAEVAQEEIDSVKEFYGRTSGERLANQLSEAQDRYNRSFGKSANPNLTRSSVDEGKNAYQRSQIAYHDIAKARMADDLDILNTPLPTDEDEEVRDAAGYSEEELNEKPNKSEYPYVISEEEFSNECPGFDKLSMYYYRNDDTLCDDQEMIVDDFDDIVGWEFFETLETQSTAWVRNERISSDFEIIGIRSSYAETVHGIGAYDIDDARLSPRERYNKRRLAADEEEE